MYILPTMLSVSSAGVLTLLENLTRLWPLSLSAHGVSNISTNPYFTVIHLSDVLKHSVGILSLTGSIELIFSVLIFHMPITKSWLSMPPSTYVLGFICLIKFINICLMCLGMMTGSVNIVRINAFPHFIDPFII